MGHYDDMVIKDNDEDFHGELQYDGGTLRGEGMHKTPLDEEIVKHLDLECKLLS